ncbi:MAG: hypothetical protein Q8L29_03415 [archaeon]|nr:hypothetical protein [archaeon]
MIVKEVRAKKIKDSRGDRTIEVSVNGCKASSPGGKSVGKYETPSYHESLDWCIDFINNLKIDFEIEKFEDLSKVDELIKSKAGFQDVKSFGANALYALESAILKALAKSEKKELWQIINENAQKFPTPAGNAIGGGVHSAGFENHPFFQEFLLFPKGNSFEEKVNVMKEIYTRVGNLIDSKKVNDEGAWQTSLSESEIFDVLFMFRDRINIGIDIAASSFYKNGNYNYKVLFSRDRQISYVNMLIDEYDLIYVEDPIQEEDFLGFRLIKKKNLVVGDDLTATQIKRLEKAIKHKSINAMIIKPNQNGSLLEIKKIFEICKKNGIETIMSHRSGETMDDALADYAFGFGADYIKTGIHGKWREAKLNRLIKIENSFK